jgi:hypothetical protein
VASVLSAVNPGFWCENKHSHQTEKILVNRKSVLTTERTEVTVNDSVVRRWSFDVSMRCVIAFDGHLNSVVLKYTPAAG